MKKTALVLILLLLAGLSAAHRSSADTNVDVSNNGDGSNNSVTIHNNIDTSNNGTSQSTTHTSVTIDNNGQVKTYDSDNPQDVHMQSDDGNTTVDINNGTNVSTNGQGATILPESTITPEVTQKPTKHTTQTREDFKNSQNNFFQELEAFFNTLFKL